MKKEEGNIKELISKLGITALNEMQDATLSLARTNQDFILYSPTGTGKTLAFLLSLLERLSKDISGVQTLILAPSRELALQIETVFKKLQTGYKVNCCYGGHPIRIERKNLETPPALLIGTPGRILDHIERENFDPTNIKTLVLDEFDKSLEFGFQADMEEIINALISLERRYLTSATKLSEIPEFVGMTQPEIIDFVKDADARKIIVKAIKSEDEADEKTDMLFHLLCKIGHEGTLVFCNHKAAIEHISQLLWGRGIVHGTYHGSLDQQERERSLVKFRNSSTNILITTDLASRGLDIPEIKNVIHFQIPYDNKTFTHRNGRTARMHATGEVFFLLTHKDYLPDYLEEKPMFIEHEEAEDLPENPKWQTIFIGGGKKDKVNKIDIVGLFCKKGGLAKDELGLIEVKDHFAYAAVRNHKAKHIIKKLNNERIKKKRLRIAMAK